ncbi:hypothetical protein D3C86_1697350 [compost metagenome]
MAAAGAPQSQADHGIGQRGQHKGAAHRGADADIFLLGGFAKNHGHERDRAFRQGGAEGRQHGAGGGSAKLETVTDPFDAVHEELAGEVDHCRGQEKQKQGEQHMNAAGRAETIGATLRLARLG